MPTRRTFLTAAAIAAHTPALLAEAQETPTDALPDGVIRPFDWGSRSIPMTGTGSPATAVIDEAVTNAMREHGIVGCGVCVMRGTGIVYSRGFGYAELGKAPFLPTTATRCGSLAKPVTALCALLLFDGGELDLDAKVLPVLKHVGIVPKPMGGTQVDPRIDEITVRSLMDHTSGLPGWATYSAWRENRNVAALQHLDHVATAADVVSDALGNTALDSAPGTKFQYANANFVILARVIEARSKMKFNDFLTRVAMPKFGVKPDEIYVSRNQTRSTGGERGPNEALYYQTSTERYVSFLPAEVTKGRIFGEAYRGYATESSDGAGGIACTAPGLCKIVMNLHSARPAISDAAMRQILTPPEHYSSEAGFDSGSSMFYSKGFEVRFFGGRPLLSHSGMTNHAGGMIGYNAGYQFVTVSNWNAPAQPYVDSILDHAVAGAVAKIDR